MRRDGRCRGRQQARRTREVALGREEVEQIDHEELGVLGRQVVGLEVLARRMAGQVGVGDLRHRRSRIAGHRDRVGTRRLRQGQHLDGLLGAAGIGEGDCDA